MCKATHGGLIGGTMIGNDKVEVLSRLPEEMLRYVLPGAASSFYGFE